MGFSFEAIINHTLLVSEKEYRKKLLFVRPSPCARAWNILLSQKMKESCNYAPFSLPE
jgi:hypothetical protein